MPRQWIVNPGPDLVSNCADVGRFLEEDYRTAIKNNSIPMGFEENFEPSGRKFVIIGAKSVPIATAKSVFLCLRLAGAESIVVKTASEDEGFLVQNVFDHWTPMGTEVELFSMGSDKLRDLPEWNRRIDEATDLVVFGGDDTAKAFVEFENRKRNVYIHGPKFSFQIIHTRDLTMSRLADICFDFATFYGEGCLSPRFCVLVGELDPNWFVGKQRIGVTAGASAPEILVEEVLQSIKALGALSIRKLQGVEENFKFPLPKGLRVE